MREVFAGALFLLLLVVISEPKSLGRFWAEVRSGFEQSTDGGAQ